MTTWAARRSKAAASRNLILCGRMVAGKFVCQGEIARIDSSAGGVDRWSPSRVNPGDEGPEVVVLTVGFKEDPAGSGTWVRTTKGHKMAADARQPTRNKEKHVGQRVGADIRSGASILPGSPMKFPFRLSCPHCGSLAEVTARVLSSS